MTMEVLQSKQQIKQARKELEKLGVSMLDSSLVSLLRWFGFVRGIAVGDQVKSWDVLATLKFITEHVAVDEAVLDIGCYASEVPVALHQLGYTNLTGADLNSNLQKMPSSDCIKYVETNFMHTKFKDSSFKAITSISVIEHGFQPEALLTEMSRLLKPNGYFIASFDYWLEKIDTSGTKFFDMDWLIFSKEDVESFVELASEYGLSSIGKMNYEVSEKSINCAGNQYTFGWLVLQKAA